MVFTSFCAHAANNTEVTSKPLCSVGKRRQLELLRDSTEMVGLLIYKTGAAHTGTLLGVYEVTHLALPSFLLFGKELFTETISKMHLKAFTESRQHTHIHTQTDTHTQTQFNKIIKAQNEIFQFIAMLSSKVQLQDNSTTKLER